MNDADFASLSQGVFVIPFQPEAGPSRPSPLPRKLRKVYEDDCKRCSELQKTFERERVEDQIDAIIGWLDRCDQASILDFGDQRPRLKIGIIQSTSTDLSSTLPIALDSSYTLHGRDVPDLASAIHEIAAGFSNGAISYSKSSGTSGLDELERHAGRQEKPSAATRLLHISQAQAMNANVLSDLLYCLSRHPRLRFRVLLSAPSPSLILSSLRHADPTAVDVTVVHAIILKKRVTAADAILKPLMREPLSLPLSAEVLEELRAKDDQVGGGSRSISRAIKWLLLRSSSSSRLEEVVEHGGMTALQAIVNARRSDLMEVEDMTRNIVETDAAEALEASLDPAPRIALLKALAESEPFLKFTARGNGDVNLSMAVNGTPASTTGSHLRKRSRTEDSTVSMPEERQQPVTESVGGDLAEIHTLFQLYASAGRTVNLWDWLQGFEESTIKTVDEAKSAPTADGTTNAVEIESALEQEREKAAMDDGDENEDENSSEEKEKEVMDETEQDRLHSVFIRFCEEARMMGLLRARGKGVSRRADEVVKGVGFV
ncbi:hypothetical protein BD324DRAFT_631701 [Kockovaella imperatae]|uniref:Origin recognition complex subunit 3 winged helix C-terminal domain-containing protein n=1 Tax=Kockovaella imperatae TaxID=4999 RepID=A0A1Y1UCP6_9TREE|nr:hypothetical protein BD324DRAFT_631701 [Kockovaella imperatae]ORX35789.1 hypothetical protein BD324DRAFT_631701 [Kockovaella imperatae]